MTDGDEVDIGYHYIYEGLTFITLESFRAHYQGGAIVLFWQTRVVIDNAGLLIYRTDSSSSDYKLIGGFIPAIGGPAEGASYRLADVDVTVGVPYRYYLVDIDTSGSWTAHGRVSARRRGVSTANDQSYLR